MAKEFFYVRKKKYHRIYRIWENIRIRCRNSKSPSYKYYGAKGIDRCKEWDTFSNFENWAFSNGYFPGSSIDRIDNNKGYCPENCRWVKIQDQQRNRGNNRFYTCKGQRLSLMEWSKVLGVKRSTLSQRLYVYGWDIERVLSK